MSALSDREFLAEEMCALYSRLTGEEAAPADLELARRLAQEEEPHDHWLETGKLDYESRLFLYMAAAYAMRCMKRDTYRCAVFMRSAATALANEARA
ncbi:hypothetical protein [Desulfovibrio legallii]|uniref:Uncharacterized protein n=1 Tax=Desulfovibrio legallii TaxID=571438 RepID=A0A1G7KIP7_9BACT|nr:hypothetical protein [Desulfovibrio legallii]SDF36669.1 hypothetical protein SAMN05192586_104109 [Desulfovibrio legallii]